ncbi:MAG: DNA-directed RNA polymerase subunit alpha [Planctomycetes bacterium]|nr:DNA-directed RNA polymerase subunit alpha [Planctomycetota bacterium]
MRIRWRDFEIPNSVVCEEATRTSEYGKFLVEPFERGFGVTVGNSLRRILLSSLEGAAVVSARIEGVQHEFSSLTGVYEDVTDIILNLKNVLLQIHQGEEAEFKIRKDSKSDVTAADIQHGPEVSIMNPDLKIATLTQDIPFNVDLRARKGRGYSTAEENSQNDTEIGVIWMDASFSPVRRVRYRIENTRVGQRTNFDRLIMEIWTDGTVVPDMALVEASKILRRHLNPFVQYTEIGYELQPVDSVEAEEHIAYEDSEGLQEKLQKPISTLELSVRAYNCLDGESIHRIGDLVACKEGDLLKVRNFGKTTLDEIKEKLKALGLRLGMEVPKVEQN